MNRSVIYVLAVVVAVSVVIGITMDGKKRKSPQGGPSGHTTPPPKKPAYPPPPSSPDAYFTWAVDDRSPYLNSLDEAVKAGAQLPGPVGDRVRAYSLTKDEDGEYEEVELAAFVYHARAKLGEKGLEAEMTTLVREADDWDVSEWIAMAAGYLEGEAADELLVSLAHDPDNENVRMAAAISLGGRAAPKARDTVKGLLDDEDEDVRAVAAGVLVSFRDPDASTVIEEILGEEDWSWNESLARGLGVRGSDASLPWLDRLATNEDEDVRAAVARSLGAIGHAEAAGRLERMLDDADDDVRTAAAAALAQSYGSAKAIDVLKKAVWENLDFDIRFEAIRGIIALGREEDREFLQQVFDMKGRKQDTLSLKAWAAYGLLRK